MKENWKLLVFSSIYLYVIVCLDSLQENKVIIFVRHWRRLIEVFMSNLFGNFLWGILMMPKFD